MAERDQENSCINSLCNILVLEDNTEMCLNVSEYHIGRQYRNVCKCLRMSWNSTQKCVNRPQMAFISILGVLMAVAAASDKP